MTDETLRHPLGFASASWVGPVVLGETAPWHPLDVPWGRGARGPGWPPEEMEVQAGECLRTVLNEEWHHRLFAERDLTALQEED